MLYRECFQHLSDIERKRIAPTPPEDLRLHRLERPEPWERELVQYIWDTQPDFNLYPDYQAFYDQLAKFVGVEAKHLCVGAGIEDFIRTLMLLSADPGERIAYTAPSCAMFGIYARVFGLSTYEFLTVPFEKPTPEFIASIGQQARLVILPNPGQPAETYYTPDELKFIAKELRKTDTVFAIDEAYHGFGAESALDIVWSHDNTVVLRTFSKALGGAGLRVGYAVGNERIIKPLNAIRESGEIAGPSMHAASVLMDCWHSHIKTGVDAVCQGRDWFRETLTKAGFKAEGSLANHVMVDCDSESRAKAIAEHMLAHHVRVRTNSDQVASWLMVTCARKPVMEQAYCAFMDAWIVTSPSKLGDLA